MPSSSRCSGRRHHRRSRKKPAPSPAPASGEARDWAALPQDILLAVFLKLGPREIMRGAELVCAAWRRVAVDEPMLWRHVDVGMVSTWSPAARAMARGAVDRGALQCEAFSGGCIDDLLLLYLVERAPCLKSLHLSRFDGFHCDLEVALKKIPLLEDLEVSPSYVSSSVQNLLESVCQACPLLKKLKMTFIIVPVYDEYNDEGLIVIREMIKGVATTMCELRTLELLDCDLTAEGLMAILDCCPALESLNITGFFDGEMDTELRTKCARVKNLTVPVGSAEDYYTHDDYEIHYCHHEHRGSQYQDLYDQFPELFTDYRIPYY